MRRPRNLTMVMVVCTCVVIWVSGPPGVYGGQLEPPPDAVDETGQPVSTMHTLDEIYNLIDERCPPPIEAGIPRTGQTTSYAVGDDGDLRMGRPWPSPRFIDNSDGTVTDDLTGLIWLKNANCFGGKVWLDALASSNSLANGQCGLSDGSVPGDWRLPNVRELHSLVDFSNHNPALPSGHPFTGLPSVYYWSSTTGALGTHYAWHVDMDHGHVLGNPKDNDYYVWPVRGGN